MLGKFLIGSNNYNLDLSESDKDYKIIVMPTFEDLFFNRTLNKQIDEHTSQVDYRFFFQKLLKANPNYIEMLFSTEQIFYDEKFSFLFNQFLTFSPSILRANWSNFVSAIKEMAHNSMKRTDCESKMVARCIFFYQLLNKAYKRNGYIYSSDWRCHNLREIRTNKEALEEAKKYLPKLFNFDEKLQPSNYDYAHIDYLEEEVKSYFKDYLTK